MVVHGNSSWSSLRQSHRYHDLVTPRHECLVAQKWPITNARRHVNSNNNSNLGEDESTSVSTLARCFPRRPQHCANPRHPTSLPTPSYTTPHVTKCPHPSKPQSMRTSSSSHPAASAPMPLYRDRQTPLLAPSAVPFAAIHMRPTCRVTV